jgi:hypothetical protein
MVKPRLLLCVLAPGIYFVREQIARKPQVQIMRRIVVTR